MKLEEYIINNSSLTTKFFSIKPGADLKAKWSSQGAVIFEFLMRGTGTATINKVYPLDNNAIFGPPGNLRIQRYDEFTFLFSSADGEIIVSADYTIRANFPGSSRQTFQS